MQRASTQCCRTDVGVGLADDMSIAVGVATHSDADKVIKAPTAGSVCVALIQTCLGAVVVMA